MSPRAVLDRAVRSLLPSVPVLSRQRALMAPLDALDAPARWVFPEARGLPPNHLRIRIGAGNRMQFNQFWFRLMPLNFWAGVFSEGRARLDSRIADIGCGCGRFALALRDHQSFGMRFSGDYVGIDIDREMIGWCREHLGDERFSFHAVEAPSRVYNPDAEGSPTPALPVADASRDFVFSISLLTHLLPETLEHYLREAHRMLAPGGSLFMTVFCMEDMEGRLGGRWTFPHRMGTAYVESLEYPEAAVAYERDVLLELCARIGFEDLSVSPGPSQSVLRGRRPEQPD